MVVDEDHSLQNTVGSTYMVSWIAPNNFSNVYVSRVWRYAYQILRTAVCIIRFRGGLRDLEHKRLLPSTPPLSLHSS